METELFDLTHDDPVASIRRCGEIIRNGGTVVFPTETVYGLGANALDATAVKKIFAAKGRPGDNPLIVHIAHPSDITPLVKAVPPKAKKLMDAFWPGPLTMIMERSDVVPDEVTAGLSTVAIRFPSNPYANRLITAAGVPIAAPSANISGRPSPTKGQHVLEDMLEKVDAILIAEDAAEVGLESTVVDMTTDMPTLLRPGGITVDDLKGVVGEVAVSANITKNIIPKVAKCPGMKYKHYAPKGQMVIVRGSDDERAAKIEAAIAQLKEGDHPAVLARDETIDRYHHGVIVSLGSRKDPEEMSRNLFARLRTFDDMGITHIFAEDVEMADETLALINRMYKAAGYTFI